MSSGAAVVVPAWAKLTLSLRIVGARSDGYHLLDAEMVTVDLADDVEIDPAGDSLEVTGEPVTAGEDNLVRRALRLAGRTAGVRIHKRIPAGAGLGGGSADAAAVLRWCGHRDPLSAVAIGADVAFCLVGGRARVRGIGEIIDPEPHRDELFTLLIPPLACPTPAVYRTWDDMGQPRGDHGNDLEPAALALVPELDTYRQRLYELTGIRPRLAGSGSTWFVPGVHLGRDLVVVRTVPAALDHSVLETSEPA